MGDLEKWRWREVKGAERRERDGVGDGRGVGVRAEGKRGNREGEVGRGRQM